MQVILNNIPSDLESFRALPQLSLASPEDTCAAFLCALALFAKDKDAGTEAMNILRGPRPMTPYDTQFLRDRGATPQNSYTPQAPYVLNVLSDPRPQDVEEGYIRVFLKTAGADSPRPVKLRSKGGQWFLWEYSSPLSGIRIPAAQDPWA